MQLQGAIKTIETHGAYLYMIGNGAPTFISGFKKETGYSNPVFTDPSLATYKALNFTKSKMSSIRPSVIGRGLKAFRNGFKQEGVKGNVWQQGGVVVVSPHTQIQFYQAASSAGEDLPMDALLQSIVMK